MTSPGCTEVAFDSWCLDFDCTVLADLYVSAKAEESTRPLVYECALDGGVKGADVGA
jgi:hypothetical protein